MVGDVTDSSSGKARNAVANLIGPRLRQVRQQHKLSLRALAGKIGVTASLLSQIETGQVNPSVDTLHALAEGLGVPTCYFFEEENEHARHTEIGRSPEAGLIVHLQDRRSIELAREVTWHSLLPVDEPDLEWNEVHYPAGSISSETMQHHGGRHYFLVLEGRLTVQLAFTEYHLEPGDSMAFDGSIPHQLRNEGEDLVRAVVIVLERHQVGPPSEEPQQRYR
jgi:transcriptional regulator with XRE-family HTH domain